MLPEKILDQVTAARLALGTVQFGLNYGIANQTGQVPVSEVRRILEEARSFGVDTLDTAIAYGESEQRLGDAGVTGWRIVSKLPVLADTCSDVCGWVEESVGSSLRRLRVSQLRGLLLHRSQDLLSERGEALLEALLSLKRRRKVEKIGVSIYDPEELDALWPRYRPDLVQAPLNVIDRRLATSGWMARLHRAGVEIHVRSVFLQGVLLMDPARRPVRFARWDALWREWETWLQQENFSPLQACLRFAFCQPEISRVIVGVDSSRQLGEILASISTAPVEPPAALANSDPDLIHPLRWISS